MRAFLGPIHYWLYNKVNLQEELIDDIIRFACDKNYDSNLAEKLETQFGKLDKRPLEDIIDTSNIHGWLQGKIAISEYRLAYALTLLINKGCEVMDELKKVFYRWGQKHALEDGITALDAFKLLNDTLLDGMPCDWVNEVISESENEVKWKRTLCVHHKYWDEVNGDISNYYELREELIKGIFANSNIIYQANGDSTFSLTRR